MPEEKLLRENIRRFIPLFRMEKVFPARLRRVVYTTLSILVALGLTLIAASLLGERFFQKSLFLPTAVYCGGTLVALSFWCLFRLLEFYSRSFYYLDFTDTPKENTLPSFEVAHIFYDLLESNSRDLLVHFLASPYGVHLLRRVGISGGEIVAFVENRQAVLVSINALLTIRTLPEIAKFLVEDEEFVNFLYNHDAKPDDLIAAALWLMEDLEREKRRARWWGKVNLGRVEGFGETWAYGGAYMLGRFSSDVSTVARYSDDSGYVHGGEEVRALEQILSRARDANALLIGEEGVGTMEVLRDFARDIQSGHALPELAHKRVVMLDGGALVSSVKEKTELEREIMQVFQDAVSAGNIILALPDLPGLIVDARGLEVDIPNILERYLGSGKLQIIATADTAKFQEIIESNAILSRRFERVFLEEPVIQNVVRILQTTARRFESRYPDLFFTYQSLFTLAEGAIRYFPDGVMPDKAVDLLVELVPTIETSRNWFVTKKTVEDFLRTKTHIPIGEVDSAEREKLTHLEDLLHKRVVGQDEAINSTAGALRRARAGVRSHDKPIGSFLFLGPTGVGKTETAKALAEVFFENSKELRRLDMSEYQSADGLRRLIGSFEENKPGILASMLREYPYGVLLLDEFEKTDPKVLDLFLQILDEGVFHDAFGKKVSARNSILIATSNAGSGIIHAYLEHGKNLGDAKDEIIDAIIKEGTFKPELLNRFDGVILFHPLDRGHYIVIARMLLEKFKERLRLEKSISLDITDELVNWLIDAGSDPSFGARPMQRALKDGIEQKIADLIIAGKVPPGSKITLASGDLPVLRR